MKVFDWPSYKEPIVIFGYPRSGTSMVAKLFHLHGVWKGSTISGSGPVHPGGKYEHKYLGKQNMSFIKDVESTLKKDGYEGGYWLVKRKINKKRINNWLNNGFKPYFILVRRNEDDIIASRKRIQEFAKSIGRPPKTNVDAERENFRKTKELMDYLRNQYNGMDIHSDLLIKGNYSEITQVFSKIGIEFKPEIAESFIRSDLWKRKSYIKN